MLALLARIKRYLCLDTADESEGPGLTTRVLGDDPVPLSDTHVLRHMNSVTGEGRSGISLLRNYNRAAAPVVDLVSMLVDNIKEVETDFALTRHRLLGKGAAGTVTLCTCSTSAGDCQDVIALKELAAPEVWRPGDAQAPLSSALAALPLEEAAFQTVLTHNNIVEIYWADVYVVDPHTRKPLAVKRKTKGLGSRSLARFGSLRSVGSSSGNSRAGQQSPSDQGAPDARASVTLKMLLKESDRDQLELPKEVGLNMRIAMEYCELGALADHLLSRGRSPVPLNAIAGGMDGTLCAALCALDIARCLKLLHRVRIIHGDVKPHNILLSRRGVQQSEQDPRGFVAKLSDFGMSLLQLDQNAACEVRKGSVEYLPFEHFRNCTISFGADVYALGIVLWELWHHQLWEELYRKELNRQRFGRIDMSAFRPMCHVSCPRGYRAVVEQCLLPEGQRPSVAKVVHLLENLCTQL